VPSRGVRHLSAVDHEAVVDLWEFLFLVALVFATFCRGSSLAEVTPEHVALLKGVLDGTPVVGARLLEHLVERVGPSGRLSRILVLGRSDEIRVKGIAFRLRLLPGLLFCAMLDGCLEGVFLLSSLRLLVLSEDGFDRLLTKGELGGYVHQFARLGGSLAPQFAHQVPARGAGEECPDDVRVGDVGQLVVLLGKLSDVLSQGFPWLLAAASEIP
jgi:hypothetical protein